MSYPYANSCLRVAVLSLEPETSESWYVRVLSPMAALRDRIELLLGARLEGTRVSIDPDAIESADLVLVQRLFPTRATWPELCAVVESGKPVLYDVDDLLTAPDRTLREHLQARLCSPYTADLMRTATAVSVSSLALRDALAPYAGSIHVVPDFLHAALWHQPAKVPEEPVVIGFAGHASEAVNLAAIEAALLRVHSRLGARVRFVLLGCSTPALERLAGATVLPQPTDYPSRAHAVREAGIDIALAPLADTAFNRCRGRRRWLEYSAAGIAGVYSDLPGQREAIAPGRTGLLAGGSVEHWTQAIEELVTDAPRRLAIARAAQVEVLEHHSVTAGAPRLARLLTEVAATPRLEPRGRATFRAAG